MYLAPLTRRAALRVVGEAVSAELARELCDFYAGTVRRWTLIRPAKNKGILFLQIVVY